MGKTTGPIRIALTAGDPFGIGPEVALAASKGLPLAEVTLYGDPERLRGAERLVAVPVQGEPPARPQPSQAGGSASLQALERAVKDILAGRQDVLATAPISKRSWALAGASWTGHTTYLAQACRVKEPLMSFVWDVAEPVVALLTMHVPLRAVPGNLTSARVERAVRLLHSALVERFKRPQARIGVLGLNPHAGEEGLLGTEEIDFILPAVERLRAEGLEVAGPLPGDSAFAHRRRYDGLLAIYHDQGLGPVKALAFDRAVNTTLGLPFVRTSPAHGTAFDLAGTGRADPASMRAALDWAVRLAR